MHALAAVWVWAFLWAYPRKHEAIGIEPVEGAGWSQYLPVSYRESQSKDVAPPLA